MPVILQLMPANPSQWTATSSKQQKKLWLPISDFYPLFLPADHVIDYQTRATLCKEMCLDQHGRLFAWGSTSVRRGPCFALCLGHYTEVLQMRKGPCHGSLWDHGTSGVTGGRQMTSRPNRLYLSIARGGGGGGIRPPWIMSVVASSENFLKSSCKYWHVIDYFPQSSCKMWHIIDVLLVISLLVRLTLRAHKENIFRNS